MLYAHPTIFCFRVFGLLSSFGFVVEFWVCFEHSTHAPWCFTPIPRFFFQDLGLLSCFGFVSNISHIHTMMFYAQPTNFCYWVLGLLSNFWYVSNIPHTYTHTMMLYVHPTIFFSKFWVCCRVLGFYFEHSKHRQDDVLRPSHDFFRRVLGLLSSFGLVSNIPQTHHDAIRPHHDFLFSSFGFEIVRL